MFANIRSMIVSIAIISAISSVSAAQISPLRSPKLAVEVSQGTITGIQNLIVNEWLSASGPDVCLGGLYYVPNKSKMLSSGDISPAEVTTTSITEQATWDDHKSKWKANYRFDHSGDLLISQSGSLSTKGVYGISWGIANIPDSMTVLVPGDSGQRFGADAPSGLRSFDYPFTWESPFVIIQGKLGGLLVYSEDTRYRFKSVYVDHSDGKFRIRFETRNQAPFDDLTSVRSVTWRMRAYEGDWQVGAKMYRDWMIKHIKPIPIEEKQPSWAKEIQFVVITGVQDIPALEKLAKQIDPSQTLLYVPQWRKAGYDRDYPDYTAVPEFPAFVETAHRIGYKVMAHVNYFGCDPKNPIYESMSKYQIKDPFTKEPQWWVWPPANPDIKFAYIDPASREWRKLFIARMKELVDRYKVDALHLDQTLVIMNDANGLIDGMNSIQGAIQLQKELHQVIPDVALSGEGLDEITCIYQSFAQRHVLAIDLINGKWDNNRLAQCHPVSSCVLSPFTTMYGYLGMPNPVINLNTYIAWQRGYENYGVIPTYPYPSIEQLENPTPAVQTILDFARFFQRYHPVPDFDSKWDPNDLYRYRLNDGRRAFYRKDGGVVFAALDTADGMEVIYRRISEVNRIKVDGSIPRWLGYNDEEIIGLNPKNSYYWSRKPRDLDTPHVSDISSDAVTLSMAGVHKDFARFKLDNLANTIDLSSFGGKSESGVVLTIGGEKRYSGITFMDASGGNIQANGEDLFVHPPWRGEPGGEPNKSIGSTFVEYTISLPSASRAAFNVGVAIRPEAVGKSDGIGFKVTASDGATSITSSCHNDKSEPIPVSIDLTEFAARDVKLRLEIDPGPVGDPSFDWGVLVHPMIKMDWNQPGTVDIRWNTDPKVLAAEGTPQVSSMGAHIYRIALTLPNTITIPDGNPQAVLYPCRLAECPYTASALTSDGIETEPYSFASVSIGDASCKNETRRAIAIHPPEYGKTMADYYLILPAEPSKFVAAIGLKDGSKSTGAGFEVWVNGKQLFKETLVPDTGWLPVEVDLTPYAGQAVMLTLVVDSIDSAYYDWAVWADPTLLAKNS